MKTLGLRRLAGQLRDPNLISIPATINWSQPIEPPHLLTHYCTTLVVWSATNFGFYSLQLSKFPKFVFERTVKVAALLTVICLKIAVIFEL